MKMIRTARAQWRRLTLVHRFPRLFPLSSPCFADKETNGSSFQGAAAVKKGVSTRGSAPGVTKATPTSASRSTATSGVKNSTSGSGRSHAAAAPAARGAVRRPGSPGPSSRRGAAAGAGENGGVTLQGSPRKSMSKVRTDGRETTLHDGHG